MPEKMPPNNISFVTGIWDLDRGNAASGWDRSFDHYINNFIVLLNEMKDHNLIIFIDPSIEHIVWQHRSHNNTKVYHHRKEEFSGSFFPFFESIQSIRQNPEWYSRADWLKDSTQGSLEYYNPMVMSKMFLLHNATIFDPFGSDYFFWIDGGISNTLSLSYFNDAKILDRLLDLSSHFLFLCFPYETNCEIHGFDINGMNKYAKESVKRVARGGFFGGNKKYISEANGLYYNLLHDTLEEGYMGTEESIFTLMTYLKPETYRYEMINEDGLIYTFFENLKTNKIRNKKQTTNLYLISFNSPEQLWMVLSSFEKYERKFLTDCRLILINNSTDHKYDNDYNKLCLSYDMLEIKQNNIGICGGRQLASDHFSNTDADYMLFFEDDMTLDYEGTCSFGFKKRVDDLYDTILEIVNKENYDFLKLSFSEFYGHNGDQWSWHNLPESQRLEYFGSIKEKPPTIFHNIKSVNGTAYADGEVYYSNWPHIISRNGNSKCFQHTKWDHPYEQTWMSHLYTLTKNGKVKPGILLSSPITHNRIHHYDAKDRREN